MMKKNTMLVSIFSLMTGAFLGYMFNRVTTTAPSEMPAQTIPTAHEMKEQRSGEYSYINPLIECDCYEPSHSNSIAMMESEVKDYINNALQQQRASFISVYYRDLNFGPWMGINEHESFSPASLLKVPIMITLLKKAEKDPLFLHKKILYTKVIDKFFDQNIKGFEPLKIGISYSIEELIVRMIQDSDNEAKELLLNVIDLNFLEKVMIDIGVNPKAIETPANLVSVKDYAGFFRLLYNATYLNREMSEKALGILSKTKFDRGLKAGIPAEVALAHKFGERGYEDSNIKQLHECGIVYLKGAPYLVCVMTRGTDFDKLSGVIADVSGLVYKNVATPKN